MKKNTCALLILLFLSSCISLDLKEDNSSTHESNKLMNNSLLDSLKSQFIFSESIYHFNPDSINSFIELMGKDKHRPKPILRDLHYKIFQAPNTIDSVVNEQTYYLYNIQNQEKNIEFTIIGSNDDWINEIILLTYDINGKIIDKYILAELGGDQDLFIESESILINDTTYLKKTRQYRYNITSNSNQLTDSISTKIQIKKERF